MRCDETPDVSVILNVYIEKSYVKRTLRSLCEAAQFAALMSIKTELIVVFDRSDEGIIQIVHSADKHGFASVRYVHVNHGSLGLSRNAGIEEAHGHYVWTADYDDLVSFNCISEMYAIARDNPNSVVFPEYLVAFGESHLIARYYDHTFVRVADFVFGHPYISRIFVKRDVFADIKYLDLRLSNGLAFEDWHLNCELRMKGLSFRIAPKTAIYYRQVKGSLLKSYDAVSIRQIPHSSLFDPDRVAAMSAEEDTRQPTPILDRRRDIARSSNPANEFMSDLECLETLIAAINIDPGINALKLSRAPSWTNIFPNHHWGHDFVTACSAVGSGPFTDIVLLPFLKRGGGEKYILDVLKILSAITPGFRCLVITNEPANYHEWATNLPEHSIFLDVYNAYPHLEEADRDLLIFRLVLAVGQQNTRLHLKPSSFANRWFAKFSASVGKIFRAVYYRFSEERMFLNGWAIEMGWSFDFVSTEIKQISLVISDHNRIVRSDIERFGVYTDKWQCLYASHMPKPAAINHMPKYKILWASRISREKRPDLVPRIITAARRIVPDVTVCVAGFVDSEQYFSLFKDVPGLDYIGPFDGFDSLDPQRFDGFLYTSMFDGLPNVVLEAMAWGLPVIAPDVGGVSEAVQDGVTGWLLSDISDDEELVQAYASAIAFIYREWPRSLELGREARSLVERRHAPEVYQGRVRQIFFGV